MPQQASFKDQALQQLLERVVPAPYQKLVALLSTDLARVVAEVFRAENNAAERLDRHLRFFIGSDRPDPGLIDPLTAKTVSLSFLRELQYRTTTRPVAAAISRHLRGLEAGVPFVQPAVQPVGTRKLAVMGAKELQEDWNVLSRAQNWFKGRMKGAFTGSVEHVSRAAWKTTVGADLEKIERGAKKVGLDTPWDYLSAAMRDGWDEALWHSVIGRPFSRKLRSDSVGILASATNVAQRHAINLLPEGMVVSEYSERINDFSRNYAARMVLETEQQSTSAVKQAVLRALTDGAGESELARRMEWTWGLNPRYGQALENVYRSLTDQGKKMGLIRGQVSDYKSKLLADRAEMLANTETMVAMNFGRQLLWEDAVMRGVLPVDTKKVWVTAIDERVCEVCAPMDSVSVALNDSFVTKDNNVIVPPAHPRCRCTIVPELLVEEGIITRTSRRFGRNVSEDFDLRDNTDVDILVGKTYGSRTDGVFSGSKSSHSEVGEHHHSEGSDEEVANPYAASTPPVSKHYGPGTHPGTGTPQWVHTPKDKLYQEWDDKVIESRDLDARRNHIVPTMWAVRFRRGMQFRFGQNRYINEMANWLLERGAISPINLDVYEDDVHIIDGNHRIEAAYRLGLETVPAKVRYHEGPMPRPRTPIGRLRHRRKGEREPMPRRAREFESVQRPFQVAVNRLLERMGTRNFEQTYRVKKTLDPLDLLQEYLEWEMTEEPTDNVQRLFLDTAPNKQMREPYNEKLREHVGLMLMLVSDDEFWEGESVEKHLPGEHDQDKHGRKKGGGVGGVGATSSTSTQDSWFNRMGFARDQQLSTQEKTALVIGGMAAGIVMAYYGSKLFDDFKATPTKGDKFTFGDIDSFDEDREGLLSKKLVRSFQGDDRDVSLRNIETAIKEMPREYGFLVDDDGVVQAGWAGGRNAISIEVPRGVSRRTRRSLTFTHNHPSGGTLSDADVFTAATERFGSIRAVTPDGNVTQMTFTETPSILELNRMYERSEQAKAAWFQEIGDFWSGHLEGVDPEKVDITRRLLVGQTISDWDSPYHSSLWENFAASESSMDFFRFEGVAKWWEQMQALV